MARNTVIDFRSIAQWSGRRVIDAADRARVRVLKRAGALTRTIARRSIKSRKTKKSKPGDPPFSHVSGGRFGIRTILYIFDPKTDSVIVGPVGEGDPLAVPEALEFGGRSEITLTPRLRRKLKRRKIVTTIRARPFMQPALKTFAKTYPDMWKDAVK